MEIERKYVKLEKKVRLGSLDCEYRLYNLRISQIQYEKKIISCDIMTKQLQ